MVPLAALLRWLLVVGRHGRGRVAGGDGGAAHAHIQRQEVVGERAGAQVRLRMCAHDSGGASKCVVRARRETLAAGRNVRPFPAGYETRATKGDKLITIMMPFRLT